MANTLLTPKGWSYWTGMAKETRPDTDFLTKALIGSTKLGAKNVKASPIEDIKYDFYMSPQQIAPLRGFHDENVKVAISNKRVQRTAAIPSMPMEEDVDIREAYDAVPAPMEDLRASIGKMNPMVKQKIMAKQMEMKNMKARTIEMLLGDILQDGKISYDDGTYSYEHDFKLEESFFIDNISTKWSSNDCKPLENLRAWRKTYAKFTGKRPSLVLCGENVADALVYNENLKAKLDNYKVAEWGKMNPKFDEGELAERVMSLLGVGEIYSYFGQYDAANGVRTNYLDKDRIYLVSPSSFRLYYGSIYSTLFGGNPIKQTDVFSYVEEKPNHKGYKVYFESKPLPVVTNPYAVMSIRVL